MKAIGLLVRLTAQRMGSLDVMVAKQGRPDHLGVHLRLLDDQRVDGCGLLLGAGEVAAIQTVQPIELGVFAGDRIWSTSG